MNILLACCTNGILVSSNREGDGSVTGPVYTSPCVVTMVRLFVNEKWATKLIIIITITKIIIIITIN